MVAADVILWVLAATSVVAAAVAAVVSARVAWPLPAGRECSPLAEVLAMCREIEAAIGRAAAAEVDSLEREWLR